MTTQNYTLALVQGQTLSLSCAATQGGVAYPFTGYSIRGKIRRRFTDAASLVDLTVTITDILGGLFTVELTAAQTAALTLDTATLPAGALNARDNTIGVFDVEIYDGSGVVIRILQGAVTLSQEATK